eukprot:Gb_35891 [translate_table: standard]
MRIVTATSPYSPQEDTCILSEVIADTDSLRKKPSNKITEHEMSSKTWRVDDFVSGFPSSKRVQRTCAPETQHRRYTDKIGNGNGGLLGKRRALQDKKTNIVVDLSHKFTVKTCSIKEEKLETDAHRLSQRQKQIDYGKNTLGYERYMELVPRKQRKGSDPQTPDMNQACSKRRWDGRVRQWRRLLHAFDPPVGKDEENPELFFLGVKNKGDNIENQEMEVVEAGSPRNSIRADGNLAIYDDWVAMEP